MSTRAKLEKVVKDTKGQVIPVPLLNELKPEPEDEILFDMFFEMYTPDQNFYIVLDAYSRVWNIKFSGEDITMLQLLWRETERWNHKRQKKKMDESKKSGKSMGKPTTRPSRGHRR